jgi:hypothetical protein
MAGWGPLHCRDSCVLSLRGPIGGTDPFKIAYVPEHPASAPLAA